jgi:hypothetical protein
MIYEENPKYLAEVLSALVGEDFSDKIGVSFHQQERKSSSIPDGVILQPAVSIYIETKNWDWFYDEQLENHLESLSSETLGLNVLLALGAFDEEQASRFARIKEIFRTKYRGNIIFAAVTFEDLVSAMQIGGLPKNLSDAVADLRNFLDENNLLPSWKNLIDVANCAGIPDDILVAKVYMCPATGGSYSHARCKYFGMYRQKRVERVAQIEAVVDVELGVRENVKWRNLDIKEEEVCEVARSKVESFRPDEGPTRVFILGPQYETNFVKDSPGGMIGSKRYFDISALKVEGAEELAKKLDGRSWSDFE